MSKCSQVQPPTRRKARDLYTRDVSKRSFAPNRVQGGERQGRQDRVYQIDYPITITPYQLNANVITQAEERVF